MKSIDFIYSFQVLALVALPTSECFGQWRVINGTRSSRHEYPSIVSMAILSYSHFCAGTLVDATTVLTAAHCVYTFRHDSQKDLAAKNFTVVLGQYQLNEKGRQEKRSIVRHIIIHGNYSHKGKNKFQDDIALLKLATPITPVVPYVRFVRLPQQDEDVAPSKSSVILVGWGSMNTTVYSAANIQQKAVLTVITNSKCHERFKRVDIQICAGSGGQATGACKGDSGGPLYIRVNHGSTQPMQVGIVSYGKQPCGQPNTPTVFTRVSHYIDWIRSHL